MRIVIADKMFTKTKTISLYDGASLKEQFLTADEDEFKNIVFNLVDTFKCKDIIILGHKIFSKKLENEIREIELSKYGENKMRIEIM